MTSTAKPQTIVVLGGGVGGVAAANRLRRRLDRRHRVILINREPDFAFAASFLWVMSGTRTPAQVTRPLRSLERRGIEVVIAEVASIDPSTRTVVAGGRTYDADHLVIALGADYATGTVAGLEGHGYTYATLAGATRLHQRLEAETAGRVLVVTAAPLYRCPAAPYESALLIDETLHRRGVRGGVGITLHSAEPAPMGVAGPTVSAAVTALLAQRDIDYHPGHQITTVEPGHAHFADGASEPFDLLVYMPAIQPPRVLADSTLVGASGWIEAERSTLETTFPHVYAIGDNVHLPLSIGKPLPRAGVFAHAEALVVADNIASRIEGRPPSARFDGHGGCFIESGYSKAGYGSGDFFAEPAPAVTVTAPSRTRHWGKVAFEQTVLRRWL